MAAKTTQHKSAAAFSSPDGDNTPLFQLDYITPPSPTQQWSQLSAAGPAFLDFPFCHSSSTDSKIRPNSLKNLLHIFNWSFCWQIPLLTGTVWHCTSSHRGALSDNGVPSCTMTTHLFALRAPGFLLQAAKLPLQPQVGLLQLADSLHEVADLLQVSQTRTWRAAGLPLWLREETSIQRPVRWR